MSLISLGRQGVVGATEVRSGGCAGVLEGVAVLLHVSGTCQRYNRGANLVN